MQTLQKKYILDDERKDYICEKYFSGYFRECFNNVLWQLTSIEKGESSYLKYEKGYYCKSKHNLRYENGYYCKSDNKLGLSMIVDEDDMLFFKEASDEELSIIDIIG